MKLAFGDESFSYETLRTAAYIPYEGADIGEVLATTSRIEEGDVESWWHEWNGTAQRILAIADHCAEDGHLESARAAYLRASNYFRTAEFFLRDEGSRDTARTTWKNSVEAFDSAAELVGPTWQRLQIPYGEFDLDARLYTVDDTGKSRPTLLYCGGFDSTLEELYFSGAAAALRHGWNCLTFVGPGQGSALREHRLPFRPDWENVVTPVVDVAVHLPEVDPETIALMGMSLGGYLAPRAAAFEPRLKAVVAFDGVYDAGSLVDTLERAIPNFTTAGDAAVYAAMEADVGTDWLIRNGLWTMRADTPTEFFAKLRDYNLVDIASRISMPALVFEAEDDHFAPGQAAELFRTLSTAKSFVRLTSGEGAGEHCHMGALTLFHQHLFDWLDDTLRAR